MDEPRDHEAARRERAYRIWEREGRPENRHMEHWNEAGAETDADGSAAVPAPEAGAPTGPASAEREHPIPAPDADKKAKAR